MTQVVRGLSRVVSRDGRTRSGERETRGTMDGAPPVGPASTASLICRDLRYGLGPKGLLEISHRPIADRIAITRGPSFHREQAPCSGEWAEGTAGLRGSWWWALGSLQ